jgi:hypothetical protein
MTPRSCALGCGLWLVIMSLPALAFLLATQGELAWRRGPNNLEEDRLFLINEPAAGGLGYLAARRAASPDDDLFCVRTTVSYFLWRNDAGEDPNTRFCQCYTRPSTGAYELSDRACPGE